MTFALTIKRMSNVRGINCNFIPCFVVFLIKYRTDTITLNFRTENIYKAMSKNADTTM
jgi:hypothetical protein